MPQAFKIRSVFAHHFLVTIQAQHEAFFFEESEKEDLNITILKQKMDTLPIQKTVEITANIYS